MPLDSNMRVEAGRKTQHRWTAPRNPAAGEPKKLQANPKYPSMGKSTAGSGLQSPIPICSESCVWNRPILSMKRVSDVTRGSEGRTFPLGKLSWHVWWCKVEEELNISIPKRHLLLGAGCFPTLCKTWTWTGTPLKVKKKKDQKCTEEKEEATNSNRKILESSNGLGLKGP